MSSRSRGRKPRQINVDGVVYQYRVRPDDGFIHLSVRRDGERGQRLRVNFRYADDWIPQENGSFRSNGHRLILPGVVRLAILAGIQQGWMPAAHRPGEFRLSHADLLLAPEDWPKTGHDDKRIESN